MYIWKGKSEPVQLTNRQETFWPKGPFNPIDKARGSLVHPSMVEAHQGCAPVRLPTGSVQ